ncbi:hypothetical protein ACP0HM_22795 [Escherichia coli]
MPELAEFGGYGTRWLAMISYFIAAVVIVYLIFLTAGGIVTTSRNLYSRREG